jgi:hypothetical protein
VENIDGIFFFKGAYLKSNPLQGACAAKGIVVEKMGVEVSFGRFILVCCCVGQAMLRATQRKKNHFFFFFFFFSSRLVAARRE